MCCMFVCGLTKNKKKNFVCFFLFGWFLYIDFTARERERELQAKNSHDVYVITTIEAAKKTKQ